MSDTWWHLEYAWLGAGYRRAARDVTVGVRAGRIHTVTVDTPVPPEATRLRGLTLPGFANAHSHAFHRALRGVATSGSFWDWRTPMYDVASRLDPERYYALARATYAEMALAGICAVGEFHYVHHQSSGVAYADPNAMSAALVQAAADAGIRITVLDTCYLSGGLGDDGSHLPLSPAQRRFADRDVQEWAQRVDAFRPKHDHARVGAAIHSVRAVPSADLGEVASWATVRDAPLHVHVSEQPAENAACIAAYGRTPVELLAEAGALGTTATLVHGTHLDGDDRERVAETGAALCLCPTTEADLADGVGPAAELSETVPICLGTDSHARIDMLAEARAVELHERLTRGDRGIFDADELLEFTTTGHAVLGWPDAGRLQAGARADLVTVDLNTVGLAGHQPDQLLHATVFAAENAHIRHVIIDGRTVVRDGVHQRVDDVAGTLRTAIREVRDRSRLAADREEW